MSRLHRILRLVCLSTLLVLSSLPWTASAQLTSASVAGSLEDPSGAQIPHAPVSLVNTHTGAVSKSESNASGTFLFPSVLPGSYSLLIECNGFESTSVKGIELNVGDTKNLLIHMNVGSVQQQVTVEADTLALDTTSGMTSLIPSRSVQDLPLNGRNFTQLLELTPGVSRISVAQNSGIAPTSNPIGTYTFPAINGQTNRSNMFVLDGGNDLGSYKNTYNYEPIIDDIQEFRIATHDDRAEFGGVTGGVVTVVTKSGTSQLHGSAWEYLRNKAFNTRGYFQTIVPPLHQNQFGLIVGGPVVVPHLYGSRHKTFFFFGYEGYRQTTQSQTLITVPTAAQLAGDFSNLLTKGIVIYDPFSTTADPNNPGQYLRNPFPNNQIPSNMISPTATLYAKTFFPPASQSSSASGNSTVIIPTFVNSNNFTGRIDQTFGSRDQGFVRISEYNEPFSSTLGSPSAIQRSDLYGWNIVAHETHVFGPNTVLDSHFTRNYGGEVIECFFPGAPANIVGQLVSSGMSSVFLGSEFTPRKISFPPTITITGYLSVGGGNAYQAPSVSDTYEYGSEIIQTIGRHTIKAGGTLATNNFTEPIFTATETTSSFQTSNLEHPTSSTGASTGDALASFLLGVPSASQRRNTYESEHGGWTDGFYVQDQFQATRRLSLSIGGRWDVAIWPVYGELDNGQGYIGTMDVNNGTYVIAAVPPACSATVGAPCIPGGTLPAHVVVTPYSNRAIHKTDYRDWQARAGASYQIFHNTSLHLGYGRFYDEWEAVTQWAQNVGGTWPSLGLLNQNSLNQTTPTTSINDPLQLGSVVPQPAATPFGLATGYYNPTMKMAYSDQWNLGLEQSFTPSTILSVYYVGSHGSQLDMGGIQNTATYPASGTAAQVAARRPYPYMVPTSFSDSRGNSNYHALQAVVRLRSSRGISSLLSYTWSKSIDLACSGSFGAEGCLLQDPYNPRADRAVSAYDLPHMFSGSVVYPLPFHTGHAFGSTNPILNALLAGWQTNAIVSLSSGTPYSVTVSGDNANTGNTFVQANLVGNPIPAVRTVNKWIDPAAFQSPARFTFGTFGRNGLRSDWYRDLDLSLFKSFALVKEAQLEFRAEAFNLTNTPVFAAPGSIVGTPTFGAVSSASTSRQLQFALKATF